VKTALPLVIAGATGVGKTAIALEVARKLGGEIISVDSMQVYRGLDIGTAKATAKEREEIRHHLIDVCDLSEGFDAASFVKKADQAVIEIGERGHVPIFCGGTGLYLSAWLEGLGEAPASDTGLRAELESLPIADLLAELERLDPKTYGIIDRENRRRVIRAVEVVRLTGKPFSEQRAEWGGEVRPYFGVGLERERVDLHGRIERRVDEMFERGLVAEARGVLPQLRQNRTAAQAIGYRQLIDHFDGKMDLPAALELVKIKTRQFSKRQRTWFKRQMRLDWIALDEGAKVPDIAEQIVKRFWDRETRSGCVLNLVR
jgi:tRNA dimethylallyltransferase